MDVLDDLFLAGSCGAEEAVSPGLLVLLSENTKFCCFEGRLGVLQGIPALSMTEAEGSFGKADLQRSQR